VVESDALRVESVAGEPIALVANLPYNVSVPVLLHLLERVPSLRRGVLMVQREVGERIAAGPGSKVYGAPSVKAAWYGEWRTAGLVGRKVFWPVPNVDSILIEYRAHPEPLGDESLRRRLFELVDAAFGQRRKMLRQALAPAFGGSSQDASAALERAGLAPTARGEELSAADYLRLASV
jgi:16S rRNA (adenine1518-N6/adenine1519-N6)-dimethyltransferase